MDEDQGTATLGEREFETGKDEAWFANTNRTYNEYQDLQLQTARNREQQQLDTHAVTMRILNNAVDNDHSRQQVALQALQDAVTTAGALSKGLPNKADIAADRQWNLNETDIIAGELVKTAVFRDAIAGAVSEAAQGMIPSIVKGVAQELRNAPQPPPVQ